MPRQRPCRRRRGVTLLEVIVAATITLGVTIGLAGMSRLNALAWQNGSTDFSTQKDGQRALTRIAPTIREARSVVVGASSSTRLTLQMPLYSGSDLVVPLQNGQIISYYLSNTTGSSVASGNILWRSVDGTPDSAWSLQGGNGRVTAAGSGLQFTYTPADNPTTVHVTLTASRKEGGRTRSFTSRQEVLLRNHGL